MTRMLVDVATVRAWKNLQVDVIADPGLITLIEEVTATFIRKSRCEFVPESPNPAARVFDVTRDVVWDKQLEVGFMAAPATAIAHKDEDGTLLQTIDVATVASFPRNRESWQPIEYVRFNSVTAAAFYPGAGQTLELTAVWGFPAVPPDVAFEATKAVYARVARDVQTFSKLMNERSQGAGGFGASVGQHELPLSGQQLCEAYRAQIISAGD